MTDKVQTPKLTASVVIPVYNGADTCTQLVNRLNTVLPDLFIDWEIILINDGSADESWNTILDLASTNTHIRGINLMRNYGQHNALLCGVREARFPICITMDDDLQHPPEQIPLLLEEYLKGYDVVYALPKKLPHSWWRNIASKLSKWIIGKIMGVKINDIGAFRIFKTDLRKAFETYQSPDVYLDPLLAWGTTNFGHVVVEEDPRTIGHSNYSFGKLVRAWLLILTGYSTVPMRFASMVGFIFMLFGLGILIYVIVISATVGSVPGFPFLAAIIAIFSGVQLFSMGIFGEYLARVYTRSTDRPPYIIGETTQEADHE